ncbi:MAG TPA: hypothetical protein VME01_06640 [Solirubrobacteraceae bacterium]|nr:hypothetical protein [Solirubrobacteraceae bacterium]
MVYVVMFVLLLGVVLLISSPLRRPHAAGGEAQAAERAEEALELERSEQLIDLEAARDAKLREIRDAELDHQTGKLSDADFEAIDSVLRAETVELLRRLDELEQDPDGPAAE